MDKSSAGYLISSLVGRIKQDRIGTISQEETEALEFALKMLRGTGPALSSTRDDGTLTSDSRKAGSASADPSQPPLPVVELNLVSIADGKIKTPDVLLCLDFGTAMSKAFASGGGERMDLALGEAGGAYEYLLPSSIFIADDGKVHFGQNALGKV